MKKWMVFGLAFALILSLSACGAKEQAAETSAAAVKSESEDSAGSVKEKTTKKDKEESKKEDSKKDEEKKEAEKKEAEEKTEKEEADPAATAEYREFEFEGLILNLLGNFENNYEPDGGYAQYTDPYFGFLNVNMLPGADFGQTMQEEMYAEVPNEELGDIPVYMFSDGWSAEFKVGPDLYTLEFWVNKDNGMEVENAEWWFPDMIMHLHLTDEGKMKAAGTYEEKKDGSGKSSGTAAEEGVRIAAGDSKELQAFYMPTYKALTETSPYEFTASDPQPDTVYMIITGEGFTIDHRLITFDEKTEAEYSEQYSQSMNDLKDKLAEEGRTLYFASDPNRASMIIIVERTYPESSRTYTGLTAHDCEYTETAIDTTTHESTSFECYTMPDFVLRDIPMTMKDYYCSAWLDAHEYDEYLKGILGWLE